MINRRILLSAMSIITSISLTTGAAFAFFSDQATSSSNVFGTGTLDLSFNDTDDVETITSAFGGSAMVPGGDCVGPQTLNTYNNGTIPGNLVVATTNSGVGLSQYLRIQTLTYDGVTVPVPASTANNAYLDLADVEAAGSLPLGSIGANSGANLVMTVCLDESAPDAVQGATDDVTFTFTLNQQP